eukprot:m.1476837 g.1476837  ORF g.1476837 m.1476837 type:complete len:2338 (+) comp25158_c0_seq1:193-7206(+)
MAHTQLSNAIASSSSSGHEKKELLKHILLDLHKYVDDSVVRAQIIYRLNSATLGPTTAVKKVNTVNDFAVHIIQTAYADPHTADYNDLCDVLCENISDAKYKRTLASFRRSNSHPDAGTGCGSFCVVPPDTDAAYDIWILSTCELQSRTVQHVFDAAHVFSDENTHIKQWMTCFSYKKVDGWTGWTEAISYEKWKQIQSGTSSYGNGFPMKTTVVVEDQLNNQRLVHVLLIPEVTCEDQGMSSPNVDNLIQSIFHDFSVKRAPKLILVNGVALCFGGDKGKCAVNCGDILVGETAKKVLIPHEEVDCEKSTTDIAHSSFDILPQLGKDRRTMGVFREQAEYLLNKCLLPEKFPAPTPGELAMHTSALISEGPASHSHVQELNTQRIAALDSKLSQDENVVHSVYSSIQQYWKDDAESNPWYAASLGIAAHGDTKDSAMQSCNMFRRFYALHTSALFAYFVTNHIILYDSKFGSELLVQFNSETIPDNVRDEKICKTSQGILKDCAQPEESISSVERLFQTFSSKWNQISAFARKTWSLKSATPTQCPSQDPKFEAINRDLCDDFNRLSTESAPRAENAINRARRSSLASLQDDLTGIADGGSVCLRTGRFPMLACTVLEHTVDNVFETVFSKIARCAVQPESDLRFSYQEQKICIAKPRVVIPDRGASNGGSIEIRFLSVNGTAAELACATNPVLFEIMISWTTLFLRQLHVELCRLELEQLRISPHTTTSDHILRSCEVKCNNLEDIVLLATSVPICHVDSDIGNALCTIGKDLSVKGHCSEAVAMFQQSVEKLKDTHTKQLSEQTTATRFSPALQHVSEVSLSISNALFECGMAHLQSNDPDKAAACIARSSEYQRQAYTEFTTTVQQFTVVVGVVDSCGDPQFSQKLLHLQSSLQQGIQRSELLQGVSACVGCLSGALVATAARGQGRWLPFLVWIGTGAEAVPPLHDRRPSANVNPFVADLVAYGVKVDVVIVYMSYGASWAAEMLLSTGVADTVICISHKTRAHTCLLHNVNHDIDVVTRVLSTIISRTNSSKPGDALHPSRANVVTLVTEFFDPTHYCIQVNSHADASPALSMSQSLIAYNREAKASTEVASCDSRVKLDFPGSAEFECDIGHLGHAGELTKLLEVSVNDPVSTVIGVRADPPWATKECNKQTVHRVNGVIRHACFKASGNSNVHFVESIRVTALLDLHASLTALQKRSCGAGVVWLYNVANKRLAQIIAFVLNFCRENVRDTWVFVLGAPVSDDTWNNIYHLPAYDAATTPHRVSLPLVRVSNEPVNEVIDRSMLYDLVRLTGFDNAAMVDLGVLRQELLAGYKTKALGANFDWIAAMFIHANDVIVSVSISGLKFLYGLCNRVVLTDSSNESSNESGSMDGFDLSNIRRLFGCSSVKLDTSHFAKIYSVILKQFDIPTHHQRLELERWAAATASHPSVVHIRGPAGSGKTFLALRRAVEMLLARSESKQNTRVLFVTRSRTLAHYFCGWVLMRLRHRRTYEQTLQLFNGEYSGIHVLYAAESKSVLKPEAVYLRQVASDAGKDFQIELQEANLAHSPRDQPWRYSLIIVDEAHHVFDHDNRVQRCVLSIWNRARSSGVPMPPHGVRTRTRGQPQLSNAVCPELVVCYDFSQMPKPGFKRMPLADVSILLDEVVRNFRRVFLSSVPYSFNQHELNSYHSINGPPLTPFIFDKDRTRASTNTNYAKNIWNGIRWLTQKYPGLPLHENIAVLVGSVPALQGIRSALASVEDQSQVNFVSAAESVKRVHYSGEPVHDRINVILDHVNEFDGMERLVVFLVDFDKDCPHRDCIHQVQSKIYRGLTRAHMFVVIIQEFISGGQFAFLRDVSLIPSRDPLPGLVNGERALRNQSSLPTLKERSAESHATAAVTLLPDQAPSTPHATAMDVETETPLQAGGRDVNRHTSGASRIRRPAAPAPRQDCKRPRRSLRNRTDGAQAAATAPTSPLDSTEPASAPASPAAHPAGPRTSIEQSLFHSNQAVSVADGTFFDPYAVEISDGNLFEEITTLVNREAEPTTEEERQFFFVNDTMVDSIASDIHHEKLRAQIEIHNSQEKLLHKSDPLLSVTMCKVAAAYGDTGNYRTAIEWQNQALQMQQSVLPPLHPDIFLSLGRLALWYHALGETEKAAQLQGDALARQRQMRPPNLEELATSINNLAAMEASLQHHRRALRLQHEALDLRRRCHPAGNVAVAAAMSGLASTYRCLGQTDEALYLLRKVVRMHAVVVKRGDPAFAISLGNLAAVYCDLERYAIALKYQHIALEQLQRVFHAGDPHILTCMQGLVRILRAMHHDKEAVTLEREIAALEPTSALHASAAAASSSASK